MASRKLHSPSTISLSISHALLFPVRSRLLTVNHCLNLIAPNEPFVFRQDATPFSNVSVYTAASAQEVLQKENRAYCIDLCPRPVRSTIIRS